MSDTVVQLLPRWQCHKKVWASKIIAVSAPVVGPFECGDP